MNKTTFMHIAALAVLLSITADAFCLRLYTRTSRCYNSTVYSGGIGFWIPARALTLTGIHAGPFMYIRGPPTPPMLSSYCYTGSCGVYAYCSTKWTSASIPFYSMVVPSPVWYNDTWFNGGPATTLPDTCQMSPSTTLVDDSVFDGNLTHACPNYWPPMNCSGVYKSSCYCDPYIISMNESQAIVSVVDTSKKETPPCQVTNVICCPWCGSPPVLVAEALKKLRTRTASKPSTHSLSISTTTSATTTGDWSPTHHSLSLSATTSRSVSVSGLSETSSNYTIDRERDPSSSKSLLATPSVRKRGSLTHTAPLRRPWSESVSIALTRSLSLSDEPTLTRVREGPVDKGAPTARPKSNRASATISPASDAVEASSRQAKLGVASTGLSGLQVAAISLTAAAFIAAVCLFCVFCVARKKKEEPQVAQASSLYIPEEMSPRPENPL